MDTLTNLTTAERNHNAGLEKSSSLVASLCDAVALKLELEKT